MTDNRIARQVDAAGAVLRVVAWLVLLVGIIWAVALVIAGFQAHEPWTWMTFTATEDWASITLGIFAAAVVLVSAAAQWALLTLFGGWAAHLAEKIDRRGLGGGMAG